MLYELGRYREALDAFTAALSEDPHSASALAMRAATWLNIGRVRKAVSDVAQSLGENPEFAHAHYILSCIRSSQERPRAAEKAIREALRLEPSAVYYCRLAEIKFGRSRLVDCCRIAEEGLALDPRNIPLLLLLAKALSALGRQTEAQDCLRQALAIHPENPATHHALGKLNVHSGDAHEARNLLREARRLNPVAHNDRDALAKAYGRLLWPWRLFDPYLVRLHAWPAARRWCFLAALTAVLLALSLFLSPYPYITLPVFLLVLNWFAASFTVDMFATAAGRIAFRRDLDIAWYRLIPESTRIALPLVCHCIATVVGAASALNPMFALLFLGFTPHYELILVFMRKLNLLEAAGFAVAAFFVYLLAGCSCLCISGESTSTAHGTFLLGVVPAFIIRVDD
jgi:tetratricopeptide (TPR) repeat protein